MKSEVVLTEHELPAEVVSAIKAGKKIEAIKILRESQGLGLANAKVLVDRAASRLTPKQHVSFIIERPSPARRLMKSLLLVTLLATLYYLVVGI